MNGKFNGPDYIPSQDEKRLSNQYDRIFNLMRDGNWRTLREIEQLTGASQASISAQLRHARKSQNGSHTLEKRARGDRVNGLFEYRLLVNQKPVSEWVQTSLFQ